MEEKKYFELVTKKEQLLALLNTGFIDDDAWVRFVYEAERSGCEAMAENMSQRFIHYKQLQQKELGND